MTEDRLRKIAIILRSDSPTESEVQHLFVLTRKLIEGLPSAEADDFEPLNFYCNWTLHAVLDRGAAVARLIEVNEIVHEHREKGLDVRRFVEQITELLSLEEIRIEFNRLLKTVQAGSVPHVDPPLWRKIGLQLAEIISECPIKIAPQRLESEEIKKLRALEPISFVTEASIVRGCGPSLDQPGYSLELQHMGSTTIEATSLVTFLATEEVNPDSTMIPP